MDSRKTQALAVVVIVLGSVAGAAVVAAVLPYLSNSGPVSNGGTFAAPSGPRVNVTGTFTANLTDAPAANELRLRTSEGNITFVSNGQTNATIDSSTINGTWTNVTALDVTTNELHINPDDKAAVNVSGDADSLSFRDGMATDDGTVDFVYGGASGTTNITVRGLSTNTTIAAIDANTNDVLGSATSDGSGELTITGMPNSEHNVLLMTSKGGPQLSNATPQGKLSSSPDELSVDVADPDFPNDEVTVNISLDGSQIHSETITANQTVNTSNFGKLDLGQHNWTVNTTDGYGQQTNDSYSFELPSEITFRNESNATQVLDGNISITATFYTSDGTAIVKRTTQDGNISLRGLPNSAIVVTIESEGWYDRRVYLETIFEQSNIYLLNETARPNAINTNFVYEDRTGDFEGGTTTLRVQRALDPDGDGNFTWQTVAGDFFGAAGEFPFTGAYQVRYRLIIENAEGEQRDLGTHIPTADGTKNLVIGKIEWPVQNGTDRAFGATLHNSDQKITAVYQDGTESTTEVRIRVWESGNESNEIYNQTFANGPYGKLALENISLTQNQTEMAWVVAYNATFVDGSTTYGTRIVGGNPLHIPMSAWLLGTLVLGFITIIGSMHGPRTAQLGGITMTVAAGIFMYLQWITISVSLFFVAVLIAVGSIVYKAGVGR